MIGIVINQLNQRCQCAIQINDDAGFQCFDDSPNAITFRARINGSLEVSAMQVITFLEEWIASSDEPLSINAQLLDLDKNCAVSISSFGEPECLSDELTESPITVTTVGAIIGALLGLALIILLVIILLFLKRKLKKKAKFDTQAVSAQQ